MMEEILIPIGSMRIAKPLRELVQNNRTIDEKGTHNSKRSRKKGGNLLKRQLGKKLKVVECTMPKRDKEAQLSLSNDTSSMDKEDDKELRDVPKQFKPYSV